MDTQRLILFVAFSFSVLLLWDAWQKENQPQQAAPVAQIESGVNQLPASKEKLTVQPIAKVETAGVLQKGQRVRVYTDVLNAEIDTHGADLRKVEFTQHHDSQDKKKNFLMLDDGAQDIYVAQSGLMNSGLPSHKEIFKAEANEYRFMPGADKMDVLLHWEGNGLQVTKTYTFHKNSYAIDVSYQISNNSQLAIKPDAYFQLLRHGRPPADDPKFIQTYTGPAVYTEQLKFHKVNFSDIDDGKDGLPGKVQNGWVAMLQHYFLSAWLPQGNIDREFYTKRITDDLYSAGVILPVGEIAPGAIKATNIQLYVGPQEQDKLKALAPGLDLTVDYGWLTIIATPLFWVLSSIYKLVNNWGVAIILLTVLIKLIFYPLSAKSYHSMAQMRILGPKLQKLKEQFGDDRQRMHQAMMDLYKTEKINPLGGCLPVIVQIPVFIALYWVLLAAVELRQTPFMFWIQDLSTPDPYYILPIVMGITMIIQTKLNPTPTDPIQAKVMMFMPIAFSIFFFFFPAGLVLYWVVNNTLSIAQQWQITRAMERAAAGHVKR